MLQTLEGALQMFLCIVGGVGSAFEVAGNAFVAIAYALKAKGSLYIPNSCSLNVNLCSP